VAHADFFEGGGDGGFALGGGHTAVGEGELDVFVDGEVADEIEGLENETDLAKSFCCRDEKQYITRAKEPLKLSEN